MTDCVREPKRRGRPHADEVAAVNERVLRAALALFFELGVAATTVDQISAAAQCSKSTIYSRFPSKNEMFEASIRWAVDERCKQIAALSAPSNSSKDRIVDVLVADTHENSEHIRLVRALVAEAPRHPELSAWAYDTLRSAAISWLVAKTRSSHAAAEALVESRIEPNILRILLRGYTAATAV